MSEIKGNDIFDASAIKAPLVFAENMDVALAKIDKFIELMKKSEGAIGVAKSTKQVDVETKKLTKSKTELQKVEVQIQKAHQKNTDEFIKQKAALDKLNKSNREAVKDVNAQKDAYDKLDRELIKTRKSYKNLAAAGRENTKEAKAQLVQIRKLDGQLKKIDNTVGQNQRSVGKYSNALKGISARFIGWTAAIALATKALSSGFNAVRDNSKANAELRGILNKTRDETIALRKEQLKLGSATVFTATQVTKAQIELSRLGLSMEQVIELTPAILDGAVSLGVDMADAAELVAGQLNAFGLAATDGQRVTDVLVRSTQISAFNFIKLKDALRVVSPAAAAVGDSIEDTIGKLTAAVDANIDAGTASTALRNIYIELAKQGLTWNEAMTKINTSTDKLTTANELFGKRGAVVAIALADNTEKINENKIALDNAAGSAEAFAKAQRDNLSGDQLLWTSAWEGFFQQLNEGNSIISEFTRATIQAFTSAMQAMTRAMAGTDLETVLWEENLVKADLSLEALGKIANKSADEITKLKNILASTEDEARLISATDGLVEAEKRRVFILDLLKKKIKELNPVVIKKTETTEDDTKAIKENSKASEESLGVLKKLNRLTAELPPKFSEFQMGLFAITDRLFGKNTIDDDAKEFLKKTGDTIKAVADLSKKADEESLARESEKQQRKSEIIQESVDSSLQLFQSATDFRIQQIAQELNAVEFARQTELQNEEATEADKFAINQKFDAQKKRLLIKQANTEKANALFQIAINTGVSIAKTAATLGFPVAIPFIAAAAIVGGIQAAAVIARPLPQFDKGTDYTPKDYIAGEGVKNGKYKPELRKSKGKWSVVKEPTMFSNSPGDTIVSGKETDSILGSLSDLSGKNIMTDPGLMLGLLNNDFEHKKSEKDSSYKIQKKLDGVIDAITKKKHVSVFVNTRRNRVEERNGNTRIHRIDTDYGE